MLRHKNLEDFFVILVIFLLSLGIILPLFRPGFFPMHDDTQIARVFEMAKSLKGGMFPVRWANDLGYGFGYPIFNFYAPLAYYIGGIFVLLGLPAIPATKIMIALGMCLAGIFMYLFAKTLWGRLGGIFAAIFYLYNPYHAVDLYVRGDIAEIWAYALIPLAALGFYKIFYTSKDAPAFEKKSNLKNRVPNINTWKWIIIGSLGYAGVILSHNLTAMMVTPFLILTAFVFIAFSKNRLLTSYYLSLIIFFGLSIAAFYWIPALGEIKYTNVLSQVGGGADFHKNFVCPIQFWYSPWGYGGSVPGCVDGLSFMVGKLPLIFSFLAFIAGFMYLKKSTYQSIIIFCTFLGLVISLFLQTQYSEFFWNVFPFMALFQYPWRFLLLSSFFSSLLGGGLVCLLNLMIGKYKLIFIRLITVISVTTVIILQIKFFVPQTYTNLPSNYYTSYSMLSWNTSKISDEYLPPNFEKPKNQKYVANKLLMLPSNAKLVSEQTSIKEKKAVFSLGTTNPIIINIAYFPTWHIALDNKPVSFDITNGKLLIEASKGTHSMAVYYQQTTLELLADFISLAGTLGLFLGIIWRRRKKLHVTTNS